MSVYTWSFVALSADGRVVASASGLAPAWARSVYTAELWAVLQAASTPSVGDPGGMPCSPLFSSPVSVSGMPVADAVWVAWGLPAGSRAEVVAAFWFEEDAAR